MVLSSFDYPHLAELEIRKLVLDDFFHGLDLRIIGYIARSLSSKKDTYSLIYVIINYFVIITATGVCGSRSLHYSFGSGRPTGQQVLRPSSDLHLGHLHHLGSNLNDRACSSSVLHLAPGPLPRSQSARTGRETAREKQLQLISVLVICTP